MKNKLWEIYYDNFNNIIKLTITFLFVYQE